MTFVTCDVPQITVITVLITIINTATQSLIYLTIIEHITVKGKQINKIKLMYHCITIINSQLNSFHPNLQSVSISSIFEIKDSSLYNFLDQNLQISLKYQSSLVNTAALSMTTSTNLIISQQPNGKDSSYFQLSHKCQRCSSLCLHLV